MKVTLLEFAQRANLTYSLAYSLITVLDALGIARRVDFRKNAKGRPSVVWEVPERVEIGFDAASQDSRPGNGAA